MTLDRDPVIYLDDILDAATKAMQFVADSSFDEFEHDDRTTYAVLRALEIIGEAAKRVPLAVRDRSPDIPWPDMAGMRDKLIHGYHGIDLRVVWRTVHSDLPAVIEKVRELRAQLGDAC